MVAHLLLGNMSLGVCLVRPWPTLLRVSRSVTALSGLLLRFLPRRQCLTGLIEGNEYILPL